MVETVVRGCASKNKVDLRGVRLTLRIEPSPQEIKLAQSDHNARLSRLQVKATTGAN